ncbi:MAG: hypothetical protein IPM21_02560 [Acidobacteria bacterium]|nr:hypothetical protein [Acidobacteriota bacterium]
MGRNLAVLFFIPAVLLFSFPAFGQSDEARRHFDRGMAAVEMAKAPEDFQVAINEFKQATVLAPDWPDAFFNLGKMQEAAEKFTDAIASYRKYLQLAPNAPDAGDVKSLINWVQFKAENVMTVEKVVRVLGQLSTWTAKDGTGFHRHIRSKGPTTVEVPSAVYLRGKQREYETWRRELAVTGSKVSFHYTFVLLDDKNVANYTVDVDVEMEVVSLTKVKVRELGVWKYWALGGDEVTRVRVYELVP